MALFKDRSLQVRMVKNDETVLSPTQDQAQFEIKAQIVADQILNILTIVGTGVLAYVAADTVRQVAIERAKK